MKSVDRFTQLVETLDTLLGPGGCPWDQEQTLKSLRKFVLEEVCEVIDAINEGRADALKEELGDLYLNVVFLSKLAEKEGFFAWDAPLLEINEKLIRRHPHIFGDERALSTSEEVLTRWDEIKKQEKKSSPTLLVPRDLPALARAEKLLSIEKKQKQADTPHSQTAVPQFATEEELGAYLLDLVAQSRAAGFHAEGALRHACLNLEKNLA